MHCTATIKFLTPDETRLLLAAITPPRDFGLFLLAYRYGSRASEVLLLQTHRP